VSGTTDERPIVISNIEKSFGSGRVLDGISLSVRQGEVYCLIGPSGSGKSTLLRCINGLETTDSGTVQVLGERVGGAGGAWDDRRAVALRTKVGMVFQQFNLFPHMTVLQNVAEAPTRVLGLDRQTARQRGRQLLAQFGLDSKASAYPSQLSGGQQQRVAIVRALAMDPSVLLFDEVTSALDPELADEVLGAMRLLVGTGMTMVVVTHEMRFAEEVGDRVALLDHGRIIEEDTTDRLFASPAAARTVEFLRSHRERVP
jgi:polar amino acid transport system ATP-binding protein